MKSQINFGNLGGGGNVEDMLLNGSYATASTTVSWGAVTANIPSGATYAMLLCSLTERGGSRTPLEDTFTNATLLAVYYDTWTTGATGSNTLVVCCLKLDSGASSFSFGADSRGKSAQIIFI